MMHPSVVGKQNIIIILKDQLHTYNRCWDIQAGFLFYLLLHIPNILLPIVLCLVQQQKHLQQFLAILEVLLTILMIIWVLLRELSAHFMLLVKMLHMQECWQDFIIDLHAIPRWYREER